MSSSETETLKALYSCRKCEWLWGATPPYDKGARFDYANKGALPAGGQVRGPSQLLADGTFDGVPDKNKTPAWIPIQLVASGAPMPAPLRGCRKAPIVTVGINPNLPNFWPGTKGDAHLTPGFETEAAYAHYYRYRGLTSERIALTTEQTWFPETLAKIQAAANPDDLFNAPEGCAWVEFEVSISHRWARALFLDSAEKRIAGKEYGWGADQVFWVLLPTKGAVKLPTDDAASVNRSRFPLDSTQQCVAGIFPAAIYQQAFLAPQATQNYVESYYENAYKLLNTIQVQADRPNPLPLVLGEDMAQLDMVACASPGWDEKRFDMPLAAISDHCVSEQGWAAKQLLHSQPAVLVVAGGIAWGLLLRSALQDAIESRKDLEGVQDASVLNWLTVRQPIKLSYVQQGQVLWACEIIISPHFSYTDGFCGRYLFIDQQAYNDFSSKYPLAAAQLNPFKTLDKNNTEKINNPSYSFMKIEVIAGQKTGIPFMRNMVNIEPEAHAILEAHWFEPRKATADAVSKVLQSKSITQDKSGRLTRITTNCQLCTEFEFPGGCDYKM